MYSVYNEVYEANKELDELFDKKYPQMKEDILRKNVLELLVKIGEFANETRVFKYWSIKPPSSKEIILDKYADCLLMVLQFMHSLDVSLDEEFDKSKDYDVINQFIYLYDISSKISENYNKEYVKNVFVNFIHLGELLNFSDEDIINGCLIKINRNKDRLKNDFSN